MSQQYKLGKLPPKHDPRTLRFARYLLPSQLPPLRQWVKWGQNCKAPWGMMLNNKLGCCAISMMGHGIQTWTANHGSELTVPDAAIQSAYSAITGYNPNGPFDGQGNNVTDRGTVILDALNYWRGIGVGGQKVGAFVSLQTSDVRELQEAIYLFGGICIGVQLPAAWQNQQVWKAPPGRVPFIGHRAWQPGSWGPHAIFFTGYDQQYFYLVSWGQEYRMEVGAAQVYLDEAYGVISPNWVNGTVAAPNGFDINALTSDLQLIGA